jgi:RNA polymerase sigma factor (sigma-70 family)
MTNEELVAGVQSGNENLVPVLWEQVERFVSMQAGKLSRQLEGDAVADYDDLFQSGYLAMVEAAKTFKPEKQVTFLTWFGYYLRSAFATVGGYRNGKEKRFALSLDASLMDGEDITLADTIQDPTDHYEAAEKRIWLEQLRAELDKALATLPEDQSDIIQRRYFHGQTLAAIADDEGVYKETVRQRENRAFNKLRKSSCNSSLRQFVEERTPYYMSVGVARFNTTATSAVEEVVMLRERIRENSRENNLKISMKKPCNH